MEELAELRGEQAAAQEMDLSWSQRGPKVASGAEQPQFWRGQKLRPSGSYGNSGGKSKNERSAYYKWLALYNAGKSNKEADEKFLPVKNKASSSSGPFKQE